MYLIANKYIVTSVQKGGVPGYSGCLEHTSAISQIHKALEHYQVPSEVAKLVMSHMDSLKMRFTVADFTTKWQRLEKGIMARCTISVVLFVDAMNLLLKVAGMQCRGPKADDDTRHPSCRAFTDDVMVMTPSIQGTRWILGSLEKMASWSRMQFNPKKCRSLSILKGKLTKSIFSIQALWLS